MDPGTTRVSPGLAVRLRRALGNAAPGGATVDTRSWQAERDGLADRFEIVEETVLSGAETRRIIELMSESAPSGHSRMAASEWDDEVSALVSELLSAIA